MSTGKDGERELIVVSVNGEFKQGLKELVQQPGYKELVAAMAEAARRWMLLHPTAELLWQDVGRTLVSGDLGDRGVQGMLARSPSAFELLAYMDERTGKQGTLMQAQFALCYIGVMR